MPSISSCSRSASRPSPRISTSAFKQIAEAIFFTLVMRPVGALIFGMLAERYGRRPTLIVNIIAFSVFELASAFAPTLTIFLVCRALFGIAMGGEWGVGAALALESLPAKGRGFFSGILQEGYVVGNLLAAALYGAVFPHLHGTGMLTGLARDVHDRRSAGACSRFICSSRSRSHRSGLKRSNGERPKDGARVGIDFKHFLTLSADLPLSRRCL